MDETIWQQLNDHWQTLYHTDPYAEFDAHLLAHEDEAFHETLASATENETLVTTLKGINERLAFVRFTDITTLERLLETCQQHLPILDAIRRGEAREARDAMWLNIEYGRANVETALKDVLSKAYLLH
jgi:DNA-binding FadR family transcriptional regulator